MMERDASSPRNLEGGGSEGVIVVVVGVRSSRGDGGVDGVDVVVLSSSRTGMRSDWGSGNDFD